MLINGRFLVRPATGVDRFAKELLAAFGELNAGTTLRTLIPRTTRPVGEVPPVLRVEPAGRGEGHAWEQATLPRLAREDDVLVNLCNTAPLWRERQLVVIHDVATIANPANFGLAFRSWYRVMLGALMRRTRLVASVSRFSADELHRHVGRSLREVEVIHEGGEHILRHAADTSVLERMGLVGRRYVLAVGSRSPNKNLACAVAAVKLQDDPDLILVAAGGGNQRVFAGAAVEDPQLRATGYVSDAQLRALYEHAACFVFPSFYEGFGLPPLEAMCCGCPVIAARSSSLPEVCGDAALYCDPSDPRTLADALRRVLGSPAAREELRAAGCERAAQFGWHRAARLFGELVRHGFR